MSYLQKMLLPGEKILFVATIHWVIFLPGLWLTAIGGTLAFFSYDLVRPFMSPQFISIVGRILAGAGLVFSIIGLWLLIGASVRQSSTELAITNRRIVAKYGFVSRATFEIMINRVTGVNFDQSVWGRILGYGTILVHGAGGDISPFDVVTNPQLFQRALMDVLENGGK